MVEFGLKWPNFAKICQKQTSFWRKVRPIFGRNLTVRVLAEIWPKLVEKLIKIITVQF
jgi:hypothetical protein